MSETESFVDVRTRLASAPTPHRDGDDLTLTLPSDAERGAASFQAAIARPDVLRAALAAMTDVRTSDLRRKAADRSDYLQFLLKQGRKATKELWEAQKRFLEAQFAPVESRSEGPLDAVLTVGDDGLRVEVFSADESSYAQLHVTPEAYADAKVGAGTTHVALDGALLEALDEVRAYRNTTLVIGKALSERIEPADRRVPLRWARALSQVQASATLPGDELELAPIDVYNILLTLRMQRAKKPPRALRYELVPGEAPRVVLEPWDKVLAGHAGDFEGARPNVVRTWGRRRLGVLAPLLPYAKSIRVRLAGAGLPTFYVVDLGGMTLTLSLSGWTDRGWAGITTFDLLVADAPAGDATDKVLRAAATPRSLDELAGEVGDRDAARAAALTLMQRGQLLADVASGAFRARDLFATPLDADALRFRDAREAEAHRLLAVDGAVQLTKVHDLGADGVRIEGVIEDAAAHRSYETGFTIDREGRTVDATCTSPQFRRSGLREGPSAPMIALRLLYARQRAELERARETEEGRKLIRAETRTLVRREKEGSTTLRVSLDDRKVVLRGGRGATFDRVQRLFFLTADEARDEYFRRLDACAKKGFLDATRGDA